MDSRAKTYFSEGGLNDLFRGELANFIYAWPMLYPEPLTCFAQKVCAILPRQEVSDIVLLLGNALMDSNNVESVKKLLTTIIADFELASEYKLPMDYRDHFTKVALQANQVDLIRSIKTLQKWITKFRGKNVEEEIKQLQTQLEELKQGINSPTAERKKAEIEKRLQELRCYQDERNTHNKWCDILEPELIYIYDATKEHAYAGKLYLSKLDMILRNSHIYMQPDPLLALQSNLAAARTELTDLIKLTGQIEDAVKCAQGDRDEAAIKAFKDCLVGYPMRSLVSLQAKFQEQFVNFSAMRLTKLNSELEPKTNSQPSPTVPKSSTQHVFTRLLKKTPSFDHLPPPQNFLNKSHVLNKSESNLLALQKTQPPSPLLEKKSSGPLFIKLGPGKVEVKSENDQRKSEVEKQPVCKH